MRKHSTLLLFVVFCLIFLRQAPGARGAEDPALSSYHQGISAKTLGEREQALEQALELYLAQYNEMKKGGKLNGLLCYNIGNCYFNLGQNGEAIFYYQLGKKLLPKNEKIESNLKMALQKRENPVDLQSNKLLEDVLFFHYSVSNAVRINILILAAFLASLSIVWLIIKTNIAARYAAILSLLACLVLFTSLAVEYYNPTLMGIVVQTTDIKRGMGAEFAPITKRPVSEGSSLEVLSLADGWYQVKLADGQKGFVAQDTLRIVTI